MVYVLVLCLGIRVRFMVRLGFTICGYGLE